MLQMLSFRQLRAAALGLALGVLGAALPAAAQNLSVQAVDVTVTKNGDTAQASFKIAVTNSSDTAIGNVRVVFADGVESYIGDVESHGKATGQPEVRTLDLAQLPTANYSVPVTVKYMTGDSEVAQPAGINVRVK